VSDAQAVVFLDSVTLLAVHDTAERRWQAWQERGVAHDVLTRRRLSLLAGFVALALASMLTGIALSGS
jgi:hypothetical protein